MGKTILIQITDEGMKVETSGFGGPGCLKETDKLTEGMRGDGLDVKMTGYKPTKDMGGTGVATKEKVSQ